MEHYFNIDLATKLGIEKAIFLHNLYYWVQKNAANKKKEDERNIEIEQAELRTKIVALKEDNKRIDALIEKKTCPTCGHEIDIMEQNNFVEQFQDSNGRF